MRVAAFLGLLTILLTSSAGFGGASYVFFFQERGPWTVLCGDDEVAGRKVCELSAPPPALGVKQNVIYVDAVGKDSFRVRIQVRDVTTSDAPVRLQVDGGQVFEARPRKGAAIWDGTEAVAILRAMTTGAAVVYTVQLAPDGTPRSTQVPLAEFGGALEVYRQVLQVHGLV